MLDKFITNIKKSLPFKKKAEDQEEQEEILEEGIDEEVQSNSKLGSSGDDAQKKRTMMIRVGLVLVIAYFAVDQFLLQPGSEETEVVTLPKPKRKRPKPMPKTEAVASAESTAGTATTPDMAVETKTESMEEKVETSLPVENVNVLEKASEEIDTISKEINNVATSEPTPEPTPESTPKESMSLGEAKEAEKKIDSEIDKMIDADNPKKEEAPAVDLKSKIAVEDPYVEPPNYENYGRGLVYSCKDKFWACVDKPAYIQCNKNMKYNKANSKTAECAVVNVYNTNEDCTLIQKYNVSKNIATDFCK